MKAQLNQMEKIMDKKLFTNGNRKIGKDTLIFNMNSAMDCPSEKLGLCELASKCYAKKAERIYPNVLPFRRRQEQAWKSTTAKEFAESFLSIVKSKKTKIKYFRFSESGDFDTQADVTKMVKVAKILEKNGIATYGYTARKDLNFRALRKVATVQGSGFMASNQFFPVSEFTGENPKCNGSDCSICKLCKVPMGKKIEVLIH